MDLVPEMPDRQWMELIARVLTSLTLIPSPRGVCNSAYYFLVAFPLIKMNNTHTITHLKLKTRFLKQIQIICLVPTDNTLLLIRPHQ